MVTLSDNDFKKVSYLVGFFNDIVDIVSNPDEELDFNTKDTSVYGIGYYKNNKGNVRLCDITMEDFSVTSFKDTVAEIGERIKSNCKYSHAKEWEELRR